MTLLSIKNLRKSFGGNLAVDRVSFTVKEGQLLALIGPNGAGKTTLFNMLGGQLAATRGSVQLQGTELLGLPPRQIARLGVGRTFQIAAAFASLTVVENVQMACLAQERRIFSFWRPAAKLYRERSLRLLDQVGMADQADRACSELAYGDIKRIELAMALAADPFVLLMDEPTAGMAPAERNELMALTRELVTQRNLAVLFTEHSMDVVFAYADRILVMARGRLVAEGTPDEIRQNAKVQEVYFGTGKTFGQ